MTECDDYDVDNWVPYSKRPEWKDVTPIEQPDDDNIVRICYTEKFQEIFNYFRAMMSSQEVSERALSLTEDAANANPSNYTVWYYRRFLLQQLKKDLASELDFCREMMEEYPKSYQIWEHRRKLVEWMKDPSKELKVTEIILSNDAKNYHAWQHRQWVISTFNLYDGELDYVDRLLEEDVRNNSAWNQRFFVMTKTSPDGIIKGESLKKELFYVIKAIEKVHSNESSWNYITGLINQCPDEEIEEVRSKVLAFCEDLYVNKSVHNHYVLAAMVDLRVNALEKSDSDKDDHLKKAIQICQDLANTHDTIRAEYWQFLERDIAKRFSSE